MGFFKVSTDEENVRDYTGNSSYISQSGIYSVLIKNVIVDQTSKGSQFINLWIEYEGQEQPLFQAMRITNNDGSVNEFGQKMFNKFCIVAGADNSTEIEDPVPAMLPIGKGGEEKECMILEQFKNIPMHIRIQMEYSLYEEQIREHKSVRNVFRYEDKATASEIVNDAKNKGAQYAKEEEYADKVTYRDGLTEEDVQQHLKNRKTGKTNETKDNKPVGGFGGRRTFGKKN